MNADIVLLGHGSRRGKDTDLGLAEATRRLQALVVGAAKVRMAGFEFTQPPLRDTVIELAAEGSRRIVVVPYFLFDGRHVTLEIPEELDLLRKDLPDVEIVYAKTLGIETELLDLVAEKVDAALLFRKLAPAPGELGVVFVNRGSRLDIDPGVRLRTIASDLESRLGRMSMVHHAQAEYASPTIQEASASLVASGCRIIVVMPYIFFPGKVLNDNIKPGMEAAGKDNPNAVFVLADTLGVDDRLIHVALKRAKEALYEMEYSYGG